MALTWWWLAVAVVVVSLAALVRWWRRDDSGTQADEPAYLAHTALLRRSPRYAALVRRELTRSRVAVLGIAAVLIGATLLAGRLARATETDATSSNRDVVLCLDASSSMWQSDAQVVGAYAKLVGDLRGDRIGMTIWSGAAVTVFPLSDDYGYVTAELARAAHAFTVQDLDYIAGIQPDNRNASSQIGDGLVSCLQRFDNPGGPRSRVVVLASDNDIRGLPIFTLDQAIRRATAAGVVVECIAPTTARAEELEAFRVACTSARGSLAVLGDDDAGAALAGQIAQMPRTRLDQPPQWIIVDRPRVGGLVALGGLAILVAATPRRRRG